MCLTFGDYAIWIELHGTDVLPRLIGMAKPSIRIDNLSYALFLIAAALALASEVGCARTMTFISAKPPSVFRSCIRCGSVCPALYSHILNRPAVSAGCDQALYTFKIIYQAYLDHFWA